MCWSGKNEPKIAEKDINVFKVVEKGFKSEKDFKSYYRYYAYNVGETHTEEIKVIEYGVSSIVDITKGLHSYSSEKCYIGLLQRRYYIYHDFFMDGQKHKLSIDYHYATDYVLHCRIPKGATYYENDEGEIVSNVLVIDSAESIEETSLLRKI